MTSSAVADGGTASERASALAHALETQVEASGVPGAQAAVVFGDGSTWQAGAGLAALAQAMSPSHLLAYGSVSKIHTAVLVLTLAQAGVLDVDDAVGRWIDDAEAGISLRQLLTHTSGLASDDVALDPVCSPAACFSYSNGAYDVLGQVIEAADGGSFAASLRRRVLDPLGLAATFSPIEESTRGEPATGYQAGGSKTAIDLFPAGEGLGWTAASGKLVGTAGDAALFLHHLFGETLLTSAAQAELLDLTTSAGLGGTNECEPGTAMSIALRTTVHGDAWFHGGFVGYFRAWAEHLPVQDVSVAVIVNSDGPVMPIVDALEAAALEGVAAGPARAGTCNADIAIRTVDGRTIMVTSDPAFDGFPSVAADGKTLTWISNRSGHNDVFVGATDGSGAVNLTNDDAHDLFPRFSPDGSTIAYSSNADGDQEIYVVGADGSNRRQLTHNEWDDLLPAWAPDGSHIAYTASGASQDIHVMSTDGSGDRPLVDGPANEWWPAWSADGSRIVYESGGVLFIVPAEGGEPVRVPVPQIRVTRFPAWAPGADILFSSDFDLYRTAADGTGLNRLTSTSLAEEAMAWGTDGSIAVQVSHWQP